MEAERRRPGKVFVMIKAGGHVELDLPFGCKEGYRFKLWKEETNFVINSKVDGITFEVFKEDEGKKIDQKRLKLRIDHGNAHIQLCLFVKKSSQFSKTYQRRVKRSNEWSNKQILKLNQCQNVPSGLEQQLLKL